MDEQVNRIVEMCVTEKSRSRLKQAWVEVDETDMKKLRLTEESVQETKKWSRKILKDDTT